MEIINKVLEIFRVPEKSIGTYCYPFIHPDPETVPVENHPQTHSGRFKGAIDFIVEEGTEIVAAADGVVIKVIDGHTQYGDDSKFIDDLNYITIFHPATGEFSQYCHIKNSSVKKDSPVSQGQPIAQTGLNGFMTKPHLHFLVYKSIQDKIGFIGLTPQFSK